MPPLLTTTQDSFPAGGQPLPGGVGYPPGLVEDFQLGASRPPGLSLAPIIFTHRPLFYKKHVVTKKYKEKVLKELEKSQESKYFNFIFFLKPEVFRQE